MPMQAVALATKTPEPASVLRFHSGGPVLGSAGVQADSSASEAAQGSFLALVQAQADNPSSDSEEAGGETPSFESGHSGPQAKDPRRETESRWHPTLGDQASGKVDPPNPEVTPEAAPEVVDETRLARALLVERPAVAAEPTTTALDLFIADESVEADLEPDSSRDSKQPAPEGRALSSDQPTGGIKRTRVRAPKPKLPKAAVASEPAASTRTQAEAAAEQSKLNVEPGREPAALSAKAPVVTEKVHIDRAPRARLHNSGGLGEPGKKHIETIDIKELTRDVSVPLDDASPQPKATSRPHSDTLTRRGNPVENVPLPVHNAENALPKNPQSGNPVEKPQSIGSGRPLQRKTRVANPMENPAPSSESVDPQPPTSAVFVPADAPSPASRHTPSGKAETEVPKGVTTDARTVHRQSEGQDTRTEPSTLSRHVLHDEQLSNLQKNSDSSDVISSPSELVENPRNTSAPVVPQPVQPQPSAINDAPPSSGPTAKGNSGTGDAIQNVRTTRVPNKPAEVPNLEVYRLRLDPHPSATKQVGRPFEAPPSASTAQVLVAASTVRPQMAEQIRRNSKPGIGSGPAKPAAHSERAANFSPVPPEARLFAATVATNDLDIDHSVSERDAATKARSADRSVPNRQPAPSELPATEQAAAGPVERSDQEPLPFAGEQGLPATKQQLPLGPPVRRSFVDISNQEAIPGARRSPDTGSPNLTGSLTPPSRLSVPVEKASYGHEPAATRPASVETALLERTHEQQALQLQVRDEKLGRVVIRLTERAGLIDAMVRTDGVRSRELLGQQLPLLVESLVRRGFETRHEGFSNNPNSREGFDQHDQPSRREQHARRQRREQKARPAFRVRLN